MPPGGTQYCDYSNLDGDNYKSYIASSRNSANVTHIPSGCGCESLKKRFISTLTVSAMSQCSRIRASMTGK